MRYLTRPVEVDAIQYDGLNDIDLPCEGGIKDSKGNICFSSDGDDVVVEKGDWLVVTADKEIHRFDTPTFNATFYRPDVQ